MSICKKNIHLPFSSVEVKMYNIRHESSSNLSSEVIDNGGNEHHDIPPYLKSLGVETLILGNRGQGAIEAIAASGLKEVPGITGNADEAAELFAKGRAQAKLLGQMRSSWRISSRVGFNMTELIPLEASDKEQSIKDNQEAFN